MVCTQHIYAPITTTAVTDYPAVATLDAGSNLAGPALNAPPTQGKSKKGIPGPHHLFRSKNIAPNPAQPSNISLQPYPPAAPVSLGPLLSLLDYLQAGVLASFGILWFLFAFGGGWWKLIWSTTLISTLGFGLMTAASLVQRKLEKEIERVRVDMHRQRGEKFAPPTPESVEWLNSFLKT